MLTFKPNMLPYRIVGQPPGGPVTPFGPLHCKTFGNQVRPPGVVTAVGSVQLYSLLVRRLFVLLYQFGYLLSEQ